PRSILLVSTSRRCDATVLSFFLHDPATSELYTLSLHDALPISPATRPRRSTPNGGQSSRSPWANDQAFAQNAGGQSASTREERGARRVRASTSRKRGSLSR